MAETADKTDPKAPHGYDSDGVTPLAPYGFKTDGTPKVSNRGRTAKKPPPGPAAARGNSAAAKKVASQREGLMQLADAIMSPAMAATSSEAFAQKVGRQRADGIAGSLIIVDGFLPAYADWVVGLAQTKPGMLAWMDRLDEGAPYLQGAIITAQLLKALAGNLANPDPRLAEAARLKGAMRNAQMAAAIEEEARRQGISLVPEPEPVREHPDPLMYPSRPAGVPA